MKRTIETAAEGDMATMTMRASGTADDVRPWHGIIPPDRPYHNIDGQRVAPPYVPPYQPPINIVTTNYPPKSDKSTELAFTVIDRVINEDVRSLLDPKDLKELKLALTVLQDKLKG